MHFDQALEFALDGDAVLFVGAGFSLGATNSCGQTFKSGGGFSAHLSSLLGRPADTELQDVADAFVASRGVAALHTELIKEFRATIVAKHHALVANVPWRRVYTTNYDTVFELASARPIRPVTLSERPRDFSPQEPLCVHLNGYVERLTSTPGDEIRLTDTSYITTAVEGSPWAATFRLDLSLAKAVLFVGYSMSDLDISRLIASTDSLRDKCFFIVGPRPTSRTEFRCGRYGTLQCYDTAWFGKQIETKRSRYTPPEDDRPSWYCVQPFQTPLADATSGSDKAVFDLFVRGTTDLNLLWNSIHAGAAPYIVARTLAREALDISLDPSKIAIVHSNLGNGKSVFLDTVKTLAAAEGHEVFSLTRRSPSIAIELAALTKSDKPILLVVDKYPGWMDALELIARHRNDNIYLLLAARTGSHEVLVDRVEELFDRRLVHEFGIDRLDSTEVEETSHLLERYGLWGERSANSARERIQYLRLVRRNRG